MILRRALRIASSSSSSSSSFSSSAAVVGGILSRCYSRSATSSVATSRPSLLYVSRRKPKTLFLATTSTTAATRTSCCAAASSRLGGGGWSLSSLCRRNSTSSRNPTIREQQHRQQQQQQQRRYSTRRELIPPQRSLHRPRRSYHGVPSTAPRAGRDDHGSRWFHSTRRSEVFGSLSSTPSSSTYSISDDDRKMILQSALQPQTSVSLQALMRTGRGEYLHKTFAEETRERHAATELVLMQVAGFLRRELPIRLAHRIQDLEGVPVLAEMASVQQVRDLYALSFVELMEFDDKISTPEKEEQFANLVENIYQRHSNVLVQMARGAYEFRQVVRNEQHGRQRQQQKAQTPSKKGAAHEFELQEETHAFLDRFYLCRIGIRVLIGQYLALREPPVENYVGIICSQTSPYEIVKRAIDDAAFMCTRKYGDAPEVIMSGRLDLTFPYVPTHLHYIMLELLKNSMRATVEWHGIDADFPAIKVIIADGADNEDVVVKVSDEGGGIPRSNMKKIWSYLFTTADPAIQEGMVGSAAGNDVDHGIDSPLAGLGYGLPISRSYCRYFGGDLSIMSMEGYGTDAFVYLTRLGNTREPLPI